MLILRILFWFWMEGKRKMRLALGREREPARMLWNIK
jgi:hypothetical protein